MSKGFTLIELLAALVVFGIIASIGLNYLLTMEDKARISSVKSNMRVAQMAAEAFATDNAGTYPGTPPDGGNSFSSYFPGGDSGGSTAGRPVTNPFSNTSAWSNFISINVADVIGERALAPSAATIAGNDPGLIGYSPITAAPVGSNFVSYAIEGVDNAKNAVSGTGPTSTLVLSNL